MSDRAAKRRFQATNDRQCNCDCDCAKAAKNLEDRFKILTDLVVNISNKIDSVQEQNNEMQPQISALLQAVVEEKESKMTLQQRDDIPVFTMFPIKSAEDMTKIDMGINSQNKNQYTSIITCLLQPDGVEKQLRNVLSDDFVMEHNVDGLQGKLSIKSYKNIYDVLIEAIDATCGTGSSEDQLRRALQRQKKRVFRRRSHPVKTETTETFESVYF
ncbi:uncharacterized protein LOC117567050 isoform X3 [Drosophila albomicans]|uniref:Uncharacterized protein LOC117567050 isoform X3 n=1 Tax=Drosophila albomicans TaxID=7291 RepID=A0A6P8WW22_DROAB|nr:uncharacterized protein LOC117567050 isoform X3 [Drosophila albomicans]XP_051859476.1 uncharacterized protein LOC117567050 isoform X3 [Drosophila albomicans]